MFRVCVQQSLEATHSVYDSFRVVQSIDSEDQLQTRIDRLSVRQRRHVLKLLEGDTDGERLPTGNDVISNQNNHCRYNKVSALLDSWLTSGPVVNCLSVMCYFDGNRAITVPRVIHSQSKLCRHVEYCFRQMMCNRYYLHKHVSAVVLHVLAQCSAMGHTYATTVLPSC